MEAALVYTQYERIFLHFIYTHIPTHTHTLETWEKVSIESSIISSGSCVGHMSRSSGAAAVSADQPFHPGLSHLSSSHARGPPCLRSLRCTPKGEGNQRVRWSECWKRRERSVMPTSCGKLALQRLTLTSPQNKHGRPQTLSGQTRLNLSPCTRCCETSETLQLETKPMEGQRHKSKPPGDGPLAPFTPFFGPNANAKANGAASSLVGVSV